MPFLPFISHTSPPLVMAILNLTPDSFSGDGIYKSNDETDEILLQKIHDLIHAGCDLIDIGAESTRPGAIPISKEEEIQRLTPIFKLMERNLISRPISIDTQKAAVARMAVERGAIMVNDISGLSNDPDMIPFLSTTICSVVLMHNTYDQPLNTGHTNIVDQVYQFFQNRLEVLSDSGIDKSRVILDMGIGFNKTQEDNLRLIKNLEVFKEFGLPLLCGVSRKSFIGKFCHETNPKDRLGGSLAALTLCVIKGANIMRVHDVYSSKQACQLVHAIQHINNSCW